MLREILAWGVCGEFDKLGLMAAIESTFSLTADSVTWLGLREGRGRVFGGDPQKSWMVLRELIIGPG